MKIYFLFVKMTILMCVNRKLLRMKSTAIQENNRNFKKNSFIPKICSDLAPYQIRNISCIELYCSARPSGLAKYYHQSELSVLITSQLRIKLNTRNEWYGDSKAEDLQRLPYSKRALLKEAMFIIAIVFKVLQSGAGVAWRKKLHRKNINQVCCLPVTKLSLCFVTFAAFETTSQSLRCTDWFA